MSEELIYRVAEEIYQKQEEIKEQIADLKDIVCDSDRKTQIILKVLRQNALEMVNISNLERKRDSELKEIKRVLLYPEEFK